MTIQDEIRRATGATTVNDGLSAHFSRTTSESLQDAESRFLLAQVAVTSLASIADMWHTFLRAAGHTGSINDMKLQYWSLQ